MPQKVIIDGEEKEVFTQEEVEVSREEAIAQYKQDNPDKSEDITKLQQELEKAKKDLDGFKDKDMNFSNMRNKISEKEKEINDLKVSIDEKIGTVKKEILEGVMKDHYNDMLKSLVGDDKELLAKVEYQYKRLADTASTKEEITKKLNDAFTLATGTNKDSFNSGAFSSGGVGGIKPQGQKQKLSPEEAELLGKLANAGGLKIDEKEYK